MSCLWSVRDEWHHQGGAASQKPHLLRGEFLPPTGAREAPRRLKRLKCWKIGFSFKPTELILHAQASWLNALSFFFSSKRMKYSEEDGTLGWALDTSQRRVMPGFVGNLCFVGAAVRLRAEVVNASYRSGTTKQTFRVKGRQFGVGLSVENFRMCPPWQQWSEAPALLLHGDRTPWVQDGGSLISSCSPSTDAEKGF